MQANAHVSDALKISFADYINNCQPADYDHVVRETFMTPLFQEMAKQAHLDFRNHVAGNFEIYLKRWLRLRIEDDDATAGFQIRRAGCIKSALSLLYRAATNAEGNLEALRPFYRLLGSFQMKRLSGWSNWWSSCDTLLCTGSRAAALAGAAARCTIVWRTNSTNRLIHSTSSSGSSIKSR